MRPWQSSRFADFEVYFETTDGRRYVEHDPRPESHAESSAHARRRVCYIECENLDEPFRVVYAMHSVHSKDFAVDIDIDGGDIGYSRGYNAGWRGIDMFQHRVQQGVNGEMICSDLVFQSSGEPSRCGEIMVIIQDGIATRVPPFAPDLRRTSHGHPEPLIPPELSVGHTRRFEKEYCTGFFEQSESTDGRFVFIFRYGTHRTSMENGILSSHHAIERPAEQAMLNGSRELPPSLGQANAAEETNGEVVEAAIALTQSARINRPGMTARQAEIAQLQARLAQLIKEEEEESRIASNPSSLETEPRHWEQPQDDDAVGEAIEIVTESNQADISTTSTRKRNKRKRRR